jgi:hypothetical protein
VPQQGTPAARRNRRCVIVPGKALYTAVLSVSPSARETRTRPAGLPVAMVAETARLPAGLGRKYVN